MIRYRDKLMSVEAWAKELGMKRTTLYARLRKKGWSVDRAMTTPTKRYEWHGAYDRPEYKIWENIWQRCTNPRATGFRHYGGRGIKVCASWESFDAFLSDMGERPYKNAQIDRIDPNGNYDPRNCRWASSLEQGSNRTDNVRITMNGKTQIVSQWARELGISTTTIFSRFYKGERDPERLLFVGRLRNTINQAVRGE